jgi:Divergent InlB B-repeat domain
MSRAGDMLDVLDSLDRDGRWDEWLRYARAINSLLVLAKRWAKLVGSLRTALQAAQRVPELEAAVAWAQHELGTLHLAVEDAAGAVKRLDTAQEIRRRLRDGEGLAATEQSLSVLCRQQARAGRTGRSRRSRRVLVAVTAVLLLLLAGGVAGAVVDPFDSGDEDSGEGGASEVAAVTVTVRIRGDGEGRVTSPSGVDCPGECVVSVERGSQVRLTAAEIGDAVFAGWRGGCQGTDRCVLTVVEPVTVTARFTAKAPDEPTLTVTRTGEGGGTVTSDPAGIDCGPTCIAPFPQGQTIVLTQVADDGSDFTGWSGADCPGTEDCTVTLDGSQEVTAAFDLEPATDVILITSVEPEESGSIAATTGSERAGQDCTDGCPYPADTQVTLTATLGEGLNTVTWVGCDTTAGTTCNVTMSTAREVSATITNEVD